MKRQTQRGGERHTARQRKQLDTCQKKRERNRYRMTESRQERERKTRIEIKKEIKRHTQRAKNLKKKT